MIKKKVIMVLVTAMIMTDSLTACQKTGDVTDNDAKQAERIMEGAADEKETSVTEQETPQQENNASLEALMNSAEYQACAEWWDFCEGYDTDSSILAQAGNEPVEAGYEYEAYNCYAAEMEKKIDEICEKYKLSKLSGFQSADDYSELCRKAGVGDFCEMSSENVKQTVLSGYLYDGAFLMEGSAILACSSISEVSYQFVRVLKGYFTSAYLNFGNLTQYDIREYTTKNEEKVFFAGGAGTNTYIIAEREKSFIVITILGDMSDITDVNDERLELMANAFAFAEIL